MARSRTVSSKTRKAANPLLDRVTPVKGKLIGVKKEGSSNNGFKVVNGRLLSASDVGVLLREAGSSRQGGRRNASPKNAKQSSAAASRIQKARDALVQQNKSNRRRATIVSTRRVTTSGTSRRVRNNNDVATSNNTRNNNNARRNNNNRQQKQNPVRRNTQNRSSEGSNRMQNQLVISTHTSAADKILVLYNLALGVKQENLKKILQKISSCQISKIRVRDLPSGSATATVSLLNANLDELERVRSLFDGALVDGRTIQVLISSASVSAMAY